MYWEINREERKARKEHFCEWCGQKIVRGELHIYRFYKFEGEIVSGRMHSECADASTQCSTEDMEEGWSFGSQKRGQPYS